MTMGVVTRDFIKNKDFQKGFCRNPVENTLEQSKV